MSNYNHNNLYFTLKQINMILTKLDRQLDGKNQEFRQCGSYRS